MAKAAQNTSRGPREKAELRAVFMFLCKPFHARGGNTWLVVHIALCCTCCRALTATELGGGSSHYTLRGQTRKNIFNCPQERFNPAREAEEVDVNCPPTPSGFSNSLVPMSFPTAPPKSSPGNKGLCLSWSPAGKRGPPSHRYEYTGQPRAGGTK